MPLRKIDDILHFREDISPFLVHLTRASGNATASDVLKTILDEQRLIPSNSEISDARFGINTMGFTAAQKKKFFGAISFTETPLNEVHCLLEIQKRKVDLQPYGLVFLKDRTVARGVEPVFYINNLGRNKDRVIRELSSLITTHPYAAARILPLISVFGYHLTPPGAAQTNKKVDFCWEREWRKPAINGDFDLVPNDIFIGLCPHDEIADFDGLFPPVQFIDPRRNMKWYATKLLAARQRLNIKYSVV